MDRLIISAIFLALWISGGTLIYWSFGNCSDTTVTDYNGVSKPYHQCPWTLAQSFSFNIDVGLSIGFCTLPESSTLSELYSVLNIMVGVLFIAVSFESFLDFISENLCVSRSEIEHRKVAALASISNQCSETAIVSSKFVSKAASNSGLVRKLMECLGDDPDQVENGVEEFETASMTERFKIVKDLVIKAKLATEADRHDAVKDVNVRTVTAQRIVSFVIAGIRERMVLIGLATGWASMAIFFSMFTEGNDFVSALYFAVTTMSTAGLMSLRRPDLDSHNIFVGIFSLGGVPIFAACLGSLSSFAAEGMQAMRDHQEDSIPHLSTEELKMALAGPDSTADKEIAFCDFLHFVVVRFKLVDDKIIHFLETQFDAIDENKSGSINLAEIKKASGIVSALAKE